MFRPHTLRDAFAVHAVKLDDSGDGLRLLQEHLGHRNFNTTASTEKYLAQNIKNGTRTCGARKIDRHILYLRGETTWLSC